jgi:TM2 domain-containing membrane protein YozV
MYYKTIMIMKRFIIILAIAMASALGASAQVANTELTEGMKYKQLKHMYNYNDYSETMHDRYSPAGAGIASFFIPGLGQMISREVGRGFAWFGGAAASYLVTGLGSILASSGQYYDVPQLRNTGAIIGLVGMVSMITVDICAIVDAVRVAKVKNMYEQDLRKEYAFDVDFHPSVNYIQTADGVQPTAGLTLALKF